MIRWFKIILVALFVGFSADSFGGTVTGYEYVMLSEGDLSFSESYLDWLVFGNVSATDSIYAEKSGGAVLGVQASGIAEPVASDFTMSWEDGAGLKAEGHQVPELGFSGFGTYIFSAQVAPGESGLLQLFMTAVKEDACTVQSTWGQDLITDLTTEIGSGYFEVAYSNSTQWTDTVSLSISTTVNSEPTFYGMSAQIPEPAVLSFVGLFGGGILFCRRIFFVVE